MHVDVKVGLVNQQAKQDKGNETTLLNLKGPSDSQRYHFNSYLTKIQILLRKPALKPFILFNLLIEHALNNPVQITHRTVVELRTTLLHWREQDCKKYLSGDLGVPQGQVVVPAVPQGGSFSLGEFDGETLGK